MKLSLSIFLFVAAALNVSAYKVPYNAQACALGPEGKGLGNGFKGYCCKTQADCIDDCLFENVLSLRVPFLPLLLMVSTPKLPSASKLTATSSKCIAGFAGKNNGKSGLNACCKSDDDCKNSCVNKKCDVN